MKSVYIYILRDPRDNSIRYVGKTIQNIRDRLLGHIRQAKRHNKWHKDRWIRILLNDKLKPTIEVIEETTNDDWEEREKYWINYYKKLGCNLTNVTDGGEGLHGHKFSEEHKKKLSNALKGNTKWLGKKHKPETKRKMSQNMKGENNPNYGKKIPRDIVRKQIAARIGNKRSAKTKQKISQSAMGNQYAKGHKQSLEHRRKLAISRAVKKREKLLSEGKFNFITNCSHKRENATGDTCLDCGEVLLLADDSEPECLCSTIDTEPNYHDDWCPARK